MKPRAFILLLAWSPAFASKPPDPRPQVPVPASFRNQPLDAERRAGAAWWKEFGDATLNSLVERAERANLDLRQAASRLAEYRANQGVSRSALAPTLDSNTSATELRGGFNQGIIKAPDRATPGGSFVSPFETGLVSGGVTMRWEADVFGGLRKSLRAARSDTQAAQANLEDVLTIVRSEVVRNYVDLRAAEDQIAIVKANIASEKELLDLVRVRADAGLAADLDVERQAAQLASVSAALPDLETQWSQDAHHIAVLLGDEPAALVDDLARSAKPLRVPPVPAALPGELLKRRPDIRRAEAEIGAAYARAGSARADLFPKFVITGLTGRQATDYSGLTLGAGNFFAAGPGVTLPIFNWGRIRSQIAARDAQLEQAMRAYEKEVLAAYEETENAFVSRTRAEERRQTLEAGVEAARRSVELAQELYVRGLGDFLSVLDAQRSEFQLERELAGANSAVLLSTVSLEKALGN